MEVKYTEDLTSHIYQDALAIRTAVFIQEQGVPTALEIENEADCVHFVLYNHDEALATCRLLKKEKGLVKLQRMAVLKKGRGLHLGKQLMMATENYAREQGYKKIILGAQNTALGFYQKIGYEIVGPEFLDANIPHHMMEKVI